MKKILALIHQMNLFEVIFFDLVIFSIGVLLGNLLSPVLTNSLYIFFALTVVGCAYFISYFFVTDSNHSSPTKKASVSRLPKRKK